MVVPVVIDAPAKLNLSLRIVAQRKDGMHLLEGESVLINLYDRVTLSPRSDGRIVREWHAADVSDEDDLSVQAARRLREIAGICNVQFGAGIHVDKKIPVGGGLGGASSDAAAVLLGLNSLWRLNLPAAELIEVAKGLGADVAFFVAGHAAKIGGVGEPVMPLKTPRNAYLLVFPPVAAMTGAVYEEYRRLTLCQKIGRIPLPFEESCNDLIPAAIRLYPAIAEVATALFKVTGRAVRMSGSGATVYSVFPDHQAACQACEQLSGAYNAEVADDIDEHPFLSKIAVVSDGE